MFTQSYFQLLNPLIMLTFSGGFLLLWHYARDIRSLRFLAASYLAGAFAMIADFLQFAMNPDLASVILSVLYLAVSVFFCAGLFQLYRNRVPWKALTVSAAAVFVVYSVCRYGLANVVPSAWIINVGIASLYFHSIYNLRNEMRNGIHRLLRGVVLASVVLLLLRTGAVFWFVGAKMTEAEYSGSLASVTLQLLLVIVSLAVAGVLFVMYGMEIVRRLTETGETDPLTGLLNRRGLEARIASLADNGPLGDASYAVVMADIDRFKSVNDTYGHEAGDAVIKAFARLLREVARDNDFVVRWGGEEFLVVIAHAETGAARLFAETVRARWETLRHDRLGGRSVTASFGIAVWRGGQDLTSAGRTADAALYRAKNEGRNRVCVLDAEAGEDHPDAAVA